MEGFTTHLSFKPCYVFMPLNGNSVPYDMWELAKNPSCLKALNMLLAWFVVVSDNLIISTGIV